MTIQLAIAGMLSLCLLLSLFQENRTTRNLKLKVFRLLELELNFASERLIIAILLMMAMMFFLI